MDQGDCDSNVVCLDRLICGLDNCPESLGYKSTTDCCYEVLFGDEDFCTIDFPCGIDEGDCDFDYECETGLMCNIDNDCSYNFGLNYKVHCCQIGKCPTTQF